MNDFIPTTHSPSDVNTSNVSPTPPRPKPLRLVGVCLIGGAGCLSTLVCAGVIVTLLLLTVSGLASEQENVAKAVDAFMLAMADKNANKAFVLFADYPQKAEMRASLESLLVGANFVIFDGYQTIEVLDCTIGLQSAAPDEPHGLVANVSGLVNYEGGYVGEFEAVLVKENGEWKLFGINVNVPPNKIEAYLKE